MQKAQRAEAKVFDASNWSVGIVVAQFNKHITGQSLESVLKRAEAYGVKKIDVVEVAGSVEIPLALQAMAKSGRYNALAAVGCVIRGETPHFDYVCKFVTEGVLRVQLDEQMPIAFGVLTCETEKQALERTKEGAGHLDAVMQLAKSLEQIKNHR